MNKWQSFKRGFKSFGGLRGEWIPEFLGVAAGMLLVMGIALLAVFTALILFTFAGKAHATADYNYQWVTQAGHGVVNTGQAKAVTLEVKNTGAKTWTQAGVHLGTSRPNDRHSGFKDTSWLADNRIAMQEVSVAPGQNAHFSFTATPDPAMDSWGGTYNEYFNLVAEGITWMPDVGIYWGWTVPAPVATVLFDWYGPGCNGWTLACGDQTTNVKDTPQFGTVTGPYDSADPTVVDQQIQSELDTGINITLIDWQPYIGPGGRDTAHSQHAARVIADEIMTKFPTMKFSFLVEQPYAGPQPYGITADIYNDFYANYASNPQFFKLYGKPFLATFYPRVSGGDSRFNVLTYSTGRAGYADYWAQPNPTKSGYQSLMTRFDNTPGCNVYGNCYYLDATYSNGLFAQQANNVLANRGIDKLVLYTGWNEYYERTNIEGHINPDSTVAADYPRLQLQNFLLNQWRQ